MIPMWAIRTAGTLAKLASVALACGGTMPSAVAQQAYPARQVTVVVNFTPGGPLDIVARSIAEHMTATLGQPFVVESRAGAAGVIGANLVAKSKPDGYTILFSIDSPFTVSPNLDQPMPFTSAEFTPVAVLAASGLAMGVHPGTGITTVEALLAKGKTGEVTFSSAGNGSPGHLAASILRDKAGIRTVHVPYKGNAPAVLAVATGEVDAGILATPGMLPHMQSGRITPLLVTSRERSRLLPRIPTAAEAGLPALELEVMYLMLVPAATPEAVVSLLNRELRNAMTKPDVQDRLRQLDLSPMDESGSAVVHRLEALRQRYAGTIKATGMQAD